MSDVDQSEETRLGDEPLREVEVDYAAEAARMRAPFERHDRERAAVNQVSKFDYALASVAAAYDVASRFFRRVRREVHGALNVNLGDFSFAVALSDPKAAKPEKTRQWVVSLGPSEIPAGTTVTLQVSPQISFRGEKIVATGDLDDLFFQGIFVGNRVQTPTFQNGLAVRAFGPLVTGNNLKFDVCDPALYLTFQVQNTGTVPRTFSASIFGEAVVQ